MIKKYVSASSGLSILFCFVLMAMTGFTNIVSAQSKAAEDFWNSRNAYLGQQPPGDIPLVFGDGLLADSGIVLGRVAFSKDGRTFYYGFARHWFSFEGTGVKQIHYDGQHWGLPQIIAHNVGTPTLSIDETKLYFGGKRSAVLVSEKTGDGWSAPVAWPQTKYALYNFMPTNSGAFYAGSNGNAGDIKNYSTYDFCKLTINGADTSIVSLGSPLNTAGFDGDFYIAPDESYIIISAKETPTFECELWISFRHSNGTWTNPVSLGDHINTGLAHRFGQYVSPDGKYLFYTKGTNEKDCHFYWVRFDTLLAKLKMAVR